VYPPLSVSNESPEVLTFRKAAPALQRYVGQVVEADTGQPIEGVHVLSVTAHRMNRRFIDLSDEDWEQG
jgi:hypothetical protein